MKRIKILSLLAILLWVVGEEIYRVGRPWDRSQPDLAALPESALVRAEVEGFRMGVAYDKGLMTQQEVWAAITANPDLKFYQDVILIGDSWISTNGVAK